MEYINECLMKFQSLSQSVREAFGQGDTYLKLKKMEEKYNVSLSFLMVLIAIDELEPDDITDYLVAKFSLTADQAEKIAEEFKDDILLPVLDGEMDKSLAQSSSFTKDKIEDIFSTGVLDMFSQPKEMIQAFNYEAFAAMDKDPLLEDRLINMFISNEELLSSASLTIDDRPHRGTIKNWLKDFIAKQGSDIFDSFILAKYINSLDGAVNLSPVEKNNLTKVLKTYRNLVFFPESMENVKVENWSIIPIEEGIEAVKKADTVKSNRIDSTTTKKQASSSNDGFSEAISLEKDLLAMLAKYNRNSLEYKAIQEELNRLKKKK